MLHLHWLIGSRLTYNPMTVFHFSAVLRCDSPYFLWTKTQIHLGKYPNIKIKKNCLKMFKCVHYIFLFSVFHCSKMSARSNLSTVFTVVFLCETKNKLHPLLPDINTVYKWGTMLLSLAGQVIQNFVVTPSLLHIWDNCNDKLTQEAFQMLFFKVWM